MWESEVKSGSAITQMASKMAKPLQKKVAGKPLKIEDTPEKSGQRIASADYRQWDRFVHVIDKSESEDTSVMLNDGFQETRLALKPGDLDSKTSEYIHDLTHAMSPQVLSSLVRAEKQKGDECMRAGEYAEAAGFYTRAMELNMDGGLGLALYANRSLAYMKLKMYERALEDIKWVLDRDPTHIKALMRQGLVLHACGQYEEALRSFDKVVEVDPDNDEVKRYVVASRKKLEEVGGSGEEKVKEEKVGKMRMAIMEAESDRGDESDISSDEEEGEGKIRELWHWSWNEQ